MGDTHAFTIHEDQLGEHPNSYNGWSFEYAVMAILKALEKSEIENLDPLKFSNYTCKKLKEDRHYSEVCYIEAEQGFFFVMRDMVDHINVIYNRWD